MKILKKGVIWFSPGDDVDTVRDTVGVLIEASEDEIKALSVGQSVEVLPAGAAEGEVG